jgi:hypothetical protein
MLRLRLENNSLINLIKSTRNVDTMFGKAHSNDSLSNPELLEKLRTVFREELKNNKEVNMVIESDCIMFDLLGLNTKLNIDGKFMAFTKPELVGIVTLLNFIDPKDVEDSS